MKPRVVFDCMVFLQGAARPTGPAGACLRLVDDDRVILCLSNAILVEVRDVLSRPKLQRKFPALTAEWVEAFVGNLTLKGVRLSKCCRATRRTNPI